MVRGIHLPKCYTKDTFCEAIWSSKPSPGGAAGIWQSIRTASGQEGRGGLAYCRRIVRLERRTDVVPGLRPGAVAQFFAYGSALIGSRQIRKFGTGGFWKFMSSSTQT